MEVEYKKDLRHNYMVVTKNENADSETFCIKMLENQAIEGILALEERQIDNKVLLYYDITAKQSMAAILDKMSLSYDKVKQFCAGIIETVERAYEYLLPEDDFILAPEYLYMDVVTNRPALCFIPGYCKRIKEQMSSLIEFLMNKVDYNDKEAVLLVYHLYAVSREEGYTFDHLTRVLQEKPQVNINRSVNEKKAESTAYYEENQGEKVNQEIDSPDYNNDKADNNGAKDEKSSNGISFSRRVHESRSSLAKNIPVMMEKLEGEKEVPCYPLKTYIYTGACIAGGIMVTILSLSTKFIYNSFGSRIDYSKLFALLLVILCMEGYLLKKIWDKKNKITKIVAKSEYIDPRQEFSHQDTSLGGGLKRTIVTDNDRAKPLGRLDYTTNNQQVKAQLYQQNNIQDNLYDRDNDSVSGLSAKHSCQSDKIAMINNMNSVFGSSSFCEEENQGKVNNPGEADNPTCLLNADFPEAEDGNNTGNHFNNNHDQSVTFILEPIDKEKYQQIIMKEFPFFIGKLKKNVDYCLENDAVSRYHAKVTREEDHFYITDLNSTNGTYVNSEAVQTYEKKEIKIGDEIAFANIKYRFSLPDIG